ncbi:MAG: ABC transporter permease [Sphaerobacteraceae bacterium]|nr:MAG: ABC transporter permease [Sphaerobacteraceae bacterium]
MTGPTGIVRTGAGNKATKLVDAPRRSRWPAMPWLIRGCVVVATLMVFAALAAPLISPHDPVSQTLVSRLQPTALHSEGSSEYLLGTDQLGRDVLSRVIHGARVSLGIGLFGMVVGLIIGSTLGILAGFTRGFFEDVVMFMVDVQLALPFIIMALAAIAIFGPSLPVLLVIVGIAGWEGFARVSRGMVLSTTENAYVEAARALGASKFRIVMKHIVPNITAPLIVLATLNLTSIILLESTLSFLGIGVQPPMASWGRMIAEGRDYLNTAWWLAVVPGAAIMMITMSISLFGDWLRDALDPTLRGR